MDTITPLTFKSTADEGLSPELIKQYSGLKASQPFSLDLDRDENIPESELRSHRLELFNEKVEALLKKHLSNDMYNDENQLKRRQQAVVQDQDYVAPHIKVGPGVIHPTVIAVGDPFRCENVAKMCDSYDQVQWNREYRLYNVTY